MASRFMQLVFAADLRKAVAHEQARRESIRRQREACQADPALCASLLAAANRRGQSEIDWPEYFRNSYLY